MSNRISGIVRDRLFLFASFRFQEVEQINSIGPSENDKFKSENGPVKFSRKNFEPSAYTTSTSTSHDPLFSFSQQCSPGPHDRTVTGYLVTSGRKQFS